MKAKLITLIIAITTISAVRAQNYQISFAGTGSSTNVEVVKVENLTQCTSISMSGGDVLNLNSSAGINDITSGTDNKMMVYPNPSNGFCIIEFYAPAIV